MAEQKRHWLHTVYAGHIGVESDRLMEFIEGMNRWIEKISQDSRIRYICGQVEKCPTTGRLHGQMYSEWKVSFRKVELIKIAPSNVEAREGTRTDAKNYCTLAVYKGKDKGQMASLPAFGEWREDSEGATNKSTQKELALHYIVNEGLTPQEISHVDPLVYFTHSHAINRLYEARML